MKILNITPLIPYPLSEGGKISQFAIIDYLRKIHEITLVLTVYSEAEIQITLELKEIWPDVDIRIISLFNKKNNTYLNNGIKQIKKFIKEKILSRNKYKQIINNSNFEEPGFINYPPAKSKALINELFEIISNGSFDIIQIDFLEYIDLVYIIPLNIKRIFVHHEIRYIKEESSIINKNGIFEKYIINLIKKPEIAHLKQYDNIFVFSNIDKTHLELEKELKGKVFNSPFPVLAENFIPLSASNNKIDKLIFIGGEAHYPNKDALIWYVNEIGVLINRVSDIKLHVIGTWFKETIEHFRTYENIIFAGFVPDIVSYSRNSIMVVPVRIGSGIRTKILYAMAQGVPVVSASVGCEGILVEDKKSILIANTAAEFANNVIRLIEDNDFRYKMAEEAQIIARKFYSQESAGTLRSNLYKKLLLPR